MKTKSSSLMANVRQKVISILAGNLNSGPSYLTTTVQFKLSVVSRFAL